MQLIRKTKNIVILVFALYVAAAISTFAATSTAQYSHDNIDKAKQCFSSKKNLLGFEYLKKIVTTTNDTSELERVEKILIGGDVTPKNNYEANILYEMLGYIYYKTNRLQEAFISFNKALQMNPEDIFLKYRLANLLYENGRNGAAIVLYNSILKENNDTQIRVSKAKALYNNGRMEEAYKEYLVILRKYPNSIQAKYGIYKLYEFSLKPDEILAKIYKNKTDYIPTDKDIIGFAQLLRNMDDIDGANNFEKFIKDNVKDAAKDDIALKKQNTPQELKKEEESKENPDIKKQQLQKEKEEALKIETQKRIQKEKEESAYRLSDFENSKVLKEQEIINKNPQKYSKYKAAIENYSKVQPQDANTKIAIANTYRQINMPYSAIKYYKQAQKLDPLNVDACYDLGLIYMELNSLETSKQYLQKALSLNSTNQKAKTLLAFVNQKLITRLVNKAYSYYEKKQYIEAFEMLDTGVKQYPHSAQIYYYRALVFDALNRNAAAIIDLQKTIELDPSYYMAYYQLGHIYEKIYDEKSALVAYERFLSVEPDEKELMKEVQNKVINLGKKYY